MSERSLAVTGAGALRLAACVPAMGFGRVLDHGVGSGGLWAVYSEGEVIATPGEFVVVCYTPEAWARCVAAFLDAPASV